MNRDHMMGWAAALLLLTCAPGAASAQDQRQAPSNAVGGNWSAEVDSAATESPQAKEVALDTAGKKAVEKINAYFNGMVHLQGSFTQTDSNRNETSGRFYVYRPGRLRFEYASPSLLRIVADGRYLSVEDHDLKTVDKYPLESTPFRMLLTEDVDLLRDARIVGYAKDSKELVLTLEDRSNESPGQIKLFFDASKGGGIELKEWIITDPQGLDTRIQVADLVKGKEVPDDLFKAATVEFPGFN